MLQRSNVCVANLKVGGLAYSLLNYFIQHSAGQGRQRGEGEQILRAYVAREEQWPVF